MPETANLTPDAVRAMAVRMITPTLDLRSTADLIQLASTWDAELRRETPGSELGDALARALLKIYEIVDERLRYLVVEGETVRGPMGIEHEGSPLVGIAADIEPFGNLDLWRTYLQDATPRPHVRPRQRRPPRELVPPQPGGPRQVPTSPRLPILDVDEEAAGISERSTLPQGVLPGPVSELVPPEVFTSVEFVINLILEITSTSLGPILGPLITIVGTVDAFEGARRTQAAAAKAWGARLAQESLLLMLTSLDSDAPERVSASEIRRYIRSNTRLERIWAQQLLVLDSVDANGLMIECLDAVAQAYNRAVQRHVGRFWDECAARNLVPTEHDLERLRRAVGIRLLEAARDQLPDPP